MWKTRAHARPLHQYTNAYNKVWAYEVGLIGAWFGLGYTPKNLYQTAVQDSNNTCRHRCTLDVYFWTASHIIRSTWVAIDYFQHIVAPLTRHVLDGANVLDDPEHRPAVSLEFERSRSHVQLML